MRSPAPASRAKQHRLMARRSDLTLVCSPVEQSLLTQHYGVPREKLVLAPFFVEPLQGRSGSASAGYSDRQHFMTIGNWRHAPNLDAAKVSPATCGLS